MKINNSELETVAVKRSQYPPEGVAEIAFAGRSNVGKSSLLNLITGRKSLARVSGSPGKTRTINFYRCMAKSDDGETGYDFRIVDLPGYGFAKISRSESEKWGEMMESYLENRKGLLKVVQLVDIRHKPTQQDVQMYDYLRYYGLDGIVVATKADKISNNERARNIKEIRKALDMGKGDVVIPVSALKKTGERELLAEIERLLAAGMEG
jgi:GTP-binding protein